MGRELAARRPEARAVLREIDDILGFSLSKIMFEGPSVRCLRSVLSN